ncbi:MAG: hypothetical protein ACKVJU_09270 [Verrucomicrobiales bacterium]
MPESKSPAPDRIECRVGSWFRRRMTILMVLLAALVLYFLYDGVTGYPKKNFNAALFSAFQSGKDGAADLPKPSDFSISGFSKNQQGGLQAAVDAGKAGETWSKFAATRHLAASEPKKFSIDEMNEQKGFAAGLVVILVLVMFFALWQQRKSIVCDQSGIDFTNGKHVDFESVKSLDLTKRDRGIAVLKTDSGQSLKVDDYKFEGAGEIIKRLREKKPDLEIISAS